MPRRPCLTVSHGAPRFSGAERSVTWEVAPARLADGRVVDLWSGNALRNGTSFATPSYGAPGGAGAAAA